MIFDYQTLPTSGKEKFLRLPLIDVGFLLEKAGLQYFKCLIDSGADYSVFPAEWGYELGLKVEQGKKIGLTGVGGHAIGYMHRINYTVGGYSVIDNSAVFSKDLKTPWGLLGREGFFSYFKKVVFQEPRKRVEIIGPK